MNNLCDVGVVVLNYNNYDLTIKSVDKIVNFNSMITIVIVDNCSLNDSYNILLNRYKDNSSVYVIKSNKNNGYAYGNNFGAKYIQKNCIDVKYLFIMNPDIIVPNINVFQVMKKYLELDEKIGCITTSTVLNNYFHQPNESTWSFLNKRELMFGCSLFRYKGKLHKDFFIEKNELSYVDVTQGCFFGIKLDNFIDAGMFDENTFLYCEEIILAKKLKKINKVGAYLPFIYIEHNHITKNKNLLSYKNKSFDLKCFYHSRKYYIKKYSGYNRFFSVISRCFLTIEMAFKLLFLRIKLR